MRIKIDWNIGQIIDTNPSIVDNTNVYWCDPNLISDEWAYQASAENIKNKKFSHDDFFKTQIGIDNDAVKEELKILTDTSIGTSVSDLNDNQRIDLLNALLFKAGAIDEKNLIKPIEDWD